MIVLMKRLLPVVLVSAFVVCGTPVQATNSVVSRSASSTLSKLSTFGKAAIFGAAVFTSACSIQGCGEIRLPTSLAIDKDDVAKIDLVKGIDRSEKWSFKNAQKNGRLVASDYHGYTITYDVAGTDDSVGVGFAYAEKGYDDRLAVVDETGHTSIVMLGDIRGVAIEDYMYAGYLATTKIKHASEVWHPNPSDVMIAYKLLDQPDDGTIYSLVVAELTDGMILVKPVYAFWPDDDAAYAFLPFQGQIVNQTIFFLVNPKHATFSDSSLLDEKEAEMSKMKSLN